MADMHSCGWIRNSWQCAGSHTPDKLPPHLKESPDAQMRDSRTPAPKYARVRGRSDITTSEKPVTLATKPVTKPVTPPEKPVTGKRGPDSVYETPADRQRAYRARKRAGDAT